MATARLHGRNSEELTSNSTGVADVLRTQELDGHKTSRYTVVQDLLGSCLGLRPCRPSTAVSWPKIRFAETRQVETHDFQYAIFVLKFAGPLVSKRGFDPQYASVFDRCAASTRSLLDMFRFSFNTKFGKDKKPINIRPATQNTQWVEISIRNATRRKRSGSGPLSWHGSLEALRAENREKVSKKSSRAFRPGASKKSRKRQKPPK